MSLPSQPRFDWEKKSVLGTDGKGSSEEYASAVTIWIAFHDKTLASNPNKVPREPRDIMLQSQLHNRAKELCSGLSDSVVQSDFVADAVLKAGHKRDAFSPVCEVCHDSIDVMNLKRGSPKSVRNFVLRVEA